MSDTTQSNSTTSGDRAGRLYVVATPIGNLDDISARAVRVLAEVDLIAAEDTRHTRRLLGHIGVRSRLLSLHEHNERERAAELVNRLGQGADIALVSDAGTPLISDPGFRLVREARAAGHQVLAVPGASAAIAALSVSGLPTNRFTFEGFLPPRSAARRSRLQALADEPRTMVFYVAPRQISAVLEDAAASFGVQRGACILRELTKVYESHYGSNLGELQATAATNESLQKGEMVLLIAGADPTDTDSSADTRLLQALLQSGLTTRTAVEVAMRLSTQPRNILYEQALELKRQIDAKTPIK